MKKINILLALFFITSLTSCNSENNDDSYSESEIYELIEKFHNGYHVEASLTIDSEYSEDYSINNSTEKESIKRDYGYLVKEEEFIPAIKIYSEDSENLYYRGSNGRITGDFLNYKNEVISETVYIGISSPYYDNRYLDPFDFITYQDFDSNLNLDTKKASFILEQYFSETLFIESASFIVNEDSVRANYKIKDKECAFETDTSEEEYLLKYSLSIEFSFLDEDFKALSPSETVNVTLSDALNSMGSSYTLLLESPQLESNVAYFVTRTGILEVQDYSANKLSTGDYYYKKDGDNYIKYSYNPGLVVDFEKIGTVELSDILPIYSDISASLFSSVSSSTYALIDAAKTYVPYYLTPVNYRLDEDDGYDASITLDSNGYISLINVTLYYGGEYITYNQSILDRGNTVYPSYFNENSTDFM